MSNFSFAACASILLFGCLVVGACSNSNGSNAPGGAGTPGSAGDSNGAGASSESGGAAGQPDSAEQAGETSQGGAPASGAVGGAANAGADTSGTPSLPAGPCTYATSGGADLPPVGAQFLCTPTSRVFQSNGQGEYSALFGAGFFLTGSNDSSTLACSISSSVAPAAGDSWTLGADHPGTCELSNQEGATTNLWKASDQPRQGSATIEFVSATLTHGTSKPSDVYYLCTVKLNGTLAGETGAADVEISGTFEIKLPFGA